MHLSTRHAKRQWIVGDSFIKGSVQQEVHRRNWRLVSRDETLAEVSNKVVVRRLRPLPRHDAEGVLEPLLHLKTRVGGEDALHRRLRDLLREESSVVNACPDGADPDLWLGVRTERER